jgi:hypothetical protein
LTRRTREATESGRLAKGVALAVGVIVAAIVIMGVFLARGYGRLGDVDQKAEDAKRAAREAKDQSIANQAVLLDVKAIADNVAANQAGIRAAVDQAGKAAQAAQAASLFLSDCFKPEGPCAKSSARNQEFVKAQLAMMLTKITSTEFKVTEIVGAKPGEPKFIATPVTPGTPQVCSPLVTALEKDVQVCMPAP